MAALPSATLPPKPWTSQHLPCRCPASAQLRASFLRLHSSSSSSTLRHRLLCLASEKSFPPNKQPPSSEPATLLDEPPAEDYYRPPLPGDQPDFWEGPGWDIVGFVAQYLWAIGIVVALIGCGIAVKTYNLGATDFKETPVFKKAMKSQGILKTPPDSKVFEESPKEAPSVQENPS